jgi:hypothetical protein
MKCGGCGCILKRENEKVIIQSEKNATGDDAGGGGKLLVPCAICGKRKPTDSLRFTFSDHEPGRQTTYRYPELPCCSDCKRKHRWLRLSGAVLAVVPIVLLLILHPFGDMVSNVVISVILGGMLGMLIKAFGFDAWYRDRYQSKISDWIHLYGKRNLYENLLRQNRDARHDTGQKKERTFPDPERKEMGAITVAELLTLNGLRVEFGTKSRIDYEGDVVDLSDNCEKIILKNVTVKPFESPPIMQEVHYLPVSDIHFITVVDRHGRGK